MYTIAMHGGSVDSKHKAVEKLEPVILITVQKLKTHAPINSDNLIITSREVYRFIWYGEGMYHYEFRETLSSSDADAVSGEKLD